MDTTIASTNPFVKTSNEAAVPAEETAVPAAPEGFDPLSSPFGQPESDDEFSFDLSNAQSQALIPAQRYIGCLSDLVKGTSSSGNPMWTFTFTILRNADSSETPFTGRTMRKFCALTPAAIGIFTNVVESLGLGEAGKPMHFTKSDALNRMCYFDVSIGEYNGQPQSNIGRLYPYTPIGQKYSQM